MEQKERDKKASYYMSVANTVSIVASIFLLALITLLLSQSALATPQWGLLFWTLPLGILMLYLGMQYLFLAHFLHSSHSERLDYNYCYRFRETFFNRKSIMLILIVCCISLLTLPFPDNQELLDKIFWRGLGLVGIISLLVISHYSAVLILRRIHQKDKPK